MSERYLPHPDELIDHDSEWLDCAIRRYRVRALNLRWPDDDEGPNLLLDPDPWGEALNPLLDKK